MTLLQELTITDARKQLSNIFDSAYNAYKPLMVKRKQTEKVLIMRKDLQQMILSEFKLKPEVIVEEDSSVTLALDTLEIYVNAENKEKAYQDLIKELKIYAQDYIQRSQLFLNAPNRSNHFPYVLRILLCENDKELRQIIEN